MMYCVDKGYVYAEFASYREAEVYCGAQGIECDNIYELENN